MRSKQPQDVIGCSIILICIEEFQGFMGVIIHEIIDILPLSHMHYACLHVHLV